MDDRIIATRDLISDFQSVFNTEAGIRVLSVLRKASGFDVPKINMNVRDAVDPYKLAFRAGEENLFLFVKGIIETDIAEMEERYQNRFAAEGE